uniref:Metallo-beta-lactamase domain-containing protein n=1 Tax=Ditylum brightwellii TaxID=49249 RepID=A0A7S4S426_9STRA
MDHHENEEQNKPHPLPIKPLDARFMFLGTASMSPSSTRNVSGNALQIGKEWTIIDCGEGTQHQILKAKCISPAKINRIFITHLHGDHCFGLPGLLCMINNAVTDTEEDKIVHLIGPRGLRNMTRAALLSSGTATMFRFRIDELWNNNDNSIILKQKNSDHKHLTSNKLRHYSQVFEIPQHPSELPGLNIEPNGKDGASATWVLPPHPGGGNVSTDWTLYAGPLVHTIASVGYVFQEHFHRGKIDTSSTLKERILSTENRSYQKKENGIKNPLQLLGELQQGRSIQIQECSKIVEIKPEDYMTPPTPGRKIAVLGDTCDSRAIASLVANANLLVHESTNYANIEEGEEPETVLQMAVLRGHSTPAMSGTFAKCCAVKLLLLTHFSSRYKGDESKESLAVMDQIVKEAQDHLGHEHVIAARDFMEVPIPIKQHHKGGGKEAGACITPVTSLDATEKASAAADSFLHRAGLS